MCTELTCNFQSSVEQFYVMVFLLLLWKTPMAFSDTPSAPPVWCNYSEKPRCVRIELDYSNGTQCFYKPPYSWIIIIIICMCLAKSLIGKFQNETMLYKKKTFQSFSWRKKNQSAAKYMHKVKSSNHAEGLMMKAIIPSLSLL